MFKVPMLTGGLFAAGLFLAPLPASAVQIGVGAVAETAPVVEQVQYGYGGRRFGPRFGGGRRGFGGPHFHGRGHGYGRGYGRGYDRGGFGRDRGFGRRGGF